jgi:hypothetical protein
MHDIWGKGISGTRRLSTNFLKKDSSAKLKRIRLNKMLQKLYLIHAEVEINEQDCKIYTHLIQVPIYCLKTDQTQATSCLLGNLAKKIKT